jgi:lipid A oxidase
MKGFWPCLIICPALVLLARGVNSARAEMVISVFGGAAFTEDNDVRLQQPGGTDLTFHRVSYSGKNLHSPPYYGARLAYFLGPNSHFGFGAEFFHAKLYLNAGDVVRITGTRTGAPVDDLETVGATISSFSISHGLNFLTADVIYRWFLSQREKNFVGRFQPYFGAGIGAVIPHVESDVGGVSYGAYQVHGPGVQGFGGMNFDLTRHWSLFAEYKFTYVDLDLRIPNGIISLTPLTHHLAAGVSLRF